MPADESKRLKRGPSFPRVQFGQLLAPIEVAGEIFNFRITAEDSLRSIRGPTPYLPVYDGNLSPSVSGRLTTADYTRTHGIFHALLQRGQRDVLLAHVGKELWVFEGWNKGWRALISPTDNNAQIADALVDDSRARAPTQFVATPNGIIIIPQADTDPRPYFYAGEVILPLGYAVAPGAPNITGPTSPAIHENLRDSNTFGYSVRRNTMNHSRRTSGTPLFHGKFGTGRIGSISTVSDRDPDGTSRPVGAPFLLSGEWRGATQWIDYFGNLSPISQESQSVRLYRRSIAFKSKKKPYPGETLQHQFIWTSIAQGPLGTIGRMLYRTKDNLNSGTTQLFEIPSSAFGRSSRRSVELISAAQFATVPENASQAFPDNVPDSALISPAVDVVPVPKFRVAQVAMGRLFVGNTPAEPGAIFYSSLGRWGTFERDAILFPDPSGQAITGLHRVEGGVLAFTQSSIYAITPSDDGLGFRSFPISTTVGCAAPDSIAELPSGLVIWLAYDGFYSYDGKEVVFLSMPLEDQLKTVNKSRIVQATATIDPVNEEYICWVATEDSVYNNKGFVFDGNGWKTRGGAQYTALCTTRDHRQYVLGTGTVEGVHVNTPTNAEGDAISIEEWGVWVLDHESRSFYSTADSRNPVFETTWIGTGESERKTALTVKLWFRETSTTEKMTIRVYRDWRKDDEVHSSTIELDSPEDPSPGWGDTTTDDAKEWQKRRPFWIRKDIYIPSCEVFKIRLEGLSQKERIVTQVTNRGTPVTKTQFVPADIEIIGLVVDESPRAGGGRMPRSS